MTKLTNSNCVKTQKLKLWQLKSSNYNKSQIMTKFKNSNCGKTQVLKLWEKNQKNPIETKLNLYQNSKYQIVTKVKNSNRYKTQTMTNLNLWGGKLKGSFSRKNLTPWQAMRCTLGSILASHNFCKGFIQIFFD